MSKIMLNLINLLKKIFKFSRNNIKVLTTSKVETILNKIINDGLVKRIKTTLKNEFNMDKEKNSEIDQYYGKRLGHERSIYNFPLKSKIDENQAIKLVKLFFSQISPEISIKANNVIEGSSEFKFIIEEYGKQIDNNANKRDSEVNFRNKEVYCPTRGDLRDLYTIVHEITHTFDTKNGDTDARRIFGEIASQCVERLLDEFLVNLNGEDLQKYGFNRNILIQDIRDRQISTFLSRKDNLLEFNNGTANKEIDLRYILAQIYSAKFMQLDKKTRIDALSNFIRNIENNDIEACSKSFGIDLENIFATIEMPIIPKMINATKETFQQVKLFNICNEILAKAENKKDFHVTFNAQDIYISLESKIPYILIIPAHKSDINTIVMESNNLETNNMRELLIQALETGKNLNDILLGNNPIFIPILPSPSKYSPYYQQLSNECFKNGNRPDLDVIDSMKRAKEILRNNYNMKISDRIFLNGYSSSGVFAQRFSLIHPDLISKVCIGGASGSIPVPTEDLEYPLGIKNFEGLFGNKFNLEEYRKIQFEYYVGEYECDIKSNSRKDDQGNPAPMHDMSYFSKSVPKSVGKKSREIFGNEMFERAKKQIEFLKKMRINISHRIIPNTAHNDREAQKLNVKLGDKNVKGIGETRSILVNSAFNEIKQEPAEQEVMN